MSKDAEQLRLGGGDLYLNGVNVGYLSGEVTLTYRRTGLKLAPAGSGSTDLVAVGTATLRASEAQFSADHLRLALGLTGSAATSTGQLSYDPSSYSFATSSTSWQGVTIGAESLPGGTVSVRFEHAKADGRKVLLILYTAVSLSELKLPFGDRNVTLYDVELLGVPDASRPCGDQIGVIVEETSD